MIFNYKSSTDKELLEYLKAGRQEVFSEIYNRYWKRLLAIAYNFSKDKSVAQEIVQEIFAGLWVRQADLNIEYKVFEWSQNEEFEVNILDR